MGGTPTLTLTPTLSSATQNVNNSGCWKHAKCVVDQYSWRFALGLKQAPFVIIWNFSGIKRYLILAQNKSS
jgi:hypothetical protein